VVTVSADLSPSAAEQQRRLAQLQLAQVKGGPARMSLLNRQVLVLYDVGGTDLWHERLPLEHVTGDGYIVVTPGQDVYYEELGLFNDDLNGIRVRPRPGIDPPGIPAAQIYALPAFSAAQLANLRAEAARELQTERAARGIGQAPAQKRFRFSVQVSKLVRCIGWPRTQLPIAIWGSSCRSRRARSPGS